MKLQNLSSSKSPVYRQGRAGVEKLTQTAKQPLWLLGAELCLFILLPTASIQKQYRSSYLSQRIKEKSPFANTGYQIVQGDDFAQVWLWDKNQQLEQQSQAGIASHAAINTIPEQLLLASVEQGFVQRSGRGFVVLECWQQHVLQGLTVYSEPLNSTLADSFQQNVSNYSDTSAASAPWQQRGYDYLDYPRHQVQWWEKEALLQPKTLSKIACYFSLVFLLFVMGSALGWKISINDKQQALSQLAELVEPQLNARDNFLQQQQINEQRFQLLGKLDLLTLAAVFEGLVGDKYQQLQEWQLNDADLKVVIKTDTPSREILEALRESDIFRQVRIEPGLSSDSVIVLAELSLSLLSNGVVNESGERLSGQGRDSE